MATVTEPTTTGDRITRRASLLRLAGLVGGTIGGVAGLKALETESALGGPAAVASGALTCILTPEMTEGPYYVSGSPRRRDITEGRPGIPLTLRLSVVDASTCRAIRGASVDIWHCDAGGLYSGTEGGSDDFLRGIRKTDAKGVAVFDTIYPGWYRGRTVHVHAKVHVGGNVVHTGQLFFPEAVTNDVYARAPYARRGAPDTPNAADSIFRNGGSRSLLRLARTGKGYAGTIAMGVQRS